MTNVTEPLAGGYNAIVNVGYDKLSWYLDNLNVDWQNVYMNEPCYGVPDDLCPMILGGAAVALSWLSLSIVRIPPCGSCEV